MHYKEGNPASEEALGRLNEVLDAEKPDLVMYTGDLVYSEPAGKILHKVVEPAVSRRIPFAVVFGNHDDEHDLTRRQLLDVIKSIPYNYTGTVEGVPGVTNFVLPVKSASADRDVTILYCFDSHAYSGLEGVKGYDWLKFGQVDWYRKNSAAYAEINGGEPLPALAFLHIPVPEYNEAAASEPAKLIGSRMEKACAPAVNSGMFSAWLESGDVMGVFAGHDHDNDYGVLWKGILLCYGRFSGGNTVYNNLPGTNGARIIELTEGVRSFKTWIRLKDNRIINEISYPGDFTGRKQ